MSYEIHADYSRRFLLPPDLEEWVPEDHPARFVREFVGSLELAALGFKERKSDDGRPNYASALLLKVWLYGYMNRVRSTRQLERMCMNDIGMVWLTSMHCPDHNTIWRFFRDNKEALKGVFQQSVRVAAKMELVGLVLNAVDGTKILADVSRRKSYYRKDLDELLSKLDDTVLEEICEEIEYNEEIEKGRECRLPKELADRKKLREKIKYQLEKLDNIVAKQLNETDEDARMIKTESGKKFCYNAQAAVDEKAGVIVSADVSQDAMDSHLLTGMLEQTKENLGDVPEETVADSGYFSGEELAKAEEMGANVLVNVKHTPTFARGNVSDDEYHQSKFTYNEKGDTYTCPKGGTLTYRGDRHKSGTTYVARLYSCIDYRECPFRHECSKSKRGRTIAINQYKSVIDCQLKRQEEPQNPVGTGVKR
ncbi:MAG: IS1182 family transposase [Euryarchaeota archaeon]|nr:IS1182 family transposase [Euryarchaeota archaeon]